MIVSVCDRCGKEQSGYYCKASFTTNGVERLARPVDICNDCEKEIVAFITTKKIK